MERLGRRGVWSRVLGVPGRCEVVVVGLGVGVGGEKLGCLEWCVWDRVRKDLVAEWGQVCSG